MKAKKRVMIDISLDEHEAFKLKALMDLFNSGTDYKLPDYAKKQADDFSKMLERVGVNS